MSADLRQSHGAPASHQRPAARPRELQDGLNHRLYHPLAWRLAVQLSATPVTPNAVSVAGALLVVMAGLAYVGLPWPVGAVAGLCLHMSWHVFDGADGDLARLTGRSSPSGELVDGICDYASHIVLYLLLGFQLQQSLGAIAWLPTLGAGLSRVVQANWYETRRRQYQWWAYGVPWLRQTQDQRGQRASGLGAAYLKLAQRTGPRSEALDAAIAGAADDAQALARVRQAVRDASAALLPPTPLLGANYRTIGLGLSMLAGSPLWYFLYEAAALNLLLLGSILRAARGVRAVSLGLAHAPAPSTRR